MKKQRFLGLLTAAVMGFTVFPTTAHAANVGDKLEVNSGHGQYKEDNVDGYSYEIWLDTRNGGQGSITLGKGGTFKAEWSATNNGGNFLARRGMNFPANKKASDYDNIVMEYEASYTSGGQNGNSRLCVYGWMQNKGAAGNPPLVEYYIIEDWKQWRPSGQSQTVIVDGAEYEIFQLDHEGPSINSSYERFKQYFSVRKQTRTSGKITVSDHFKAWAQAGWPMGNLTEVALNAEGYQSYGTADISKLTVTLGDTPVETTAPPQQTDTPSQGTEPVVIQPQGEGIAAHQNNDYAYDPNGTGFKDYMGKFFRLGTCLNNRNAQNGQVTNFIKENFNSVTCENEMKPETICQQWGSSGDNIAISLSSADPILKFAQQNNIGVRGHTFVWYSQTPGWIFKENMQQNSGSTVSPETMNKRLKSMIKNTFDAIKQNYPNLKLYAYDVCNELFKNDGGGFRGDGGEFSNWWSCYHNDSFVVNAFKYARECAPSTCKPYMNDYNKYFVKKRNDLVSMASKIIAEGDFIDGIGMQSHMHYCDFGMTGSATESKDSKFGTYADAIDAFNALGLDVQITELDVTTCSEKEGADLFVDIFKVAAERSLNISSVTLWGHCDSASWRQSYREENGKQGGNPLPFDGNCRPKSFYQNIIALRDTVTIPQPVETTTAPPEETTLAPTVSKRGDVDCNGDINIADAILLARFNAEDQSEEAKVTTQGKANADTNKDGSVNGDDLALLLSYLAGLEQSL